MTPRRIWLRTATAAAHHALEGELGGIDTANDYFRYLRAMTPFRFAVERNLSTAAAPGSFQATHLYDLLALDCSDLKVNVMTPLNAEIDYADEAGLGVAYVLEGSTLGAVLLQRSAQKLGFDEHFGARHLARQVAARGNWSAFLSYLEERPALDMDKVVQGANATFALAQSAARDAKNAG